MSMDRATSLDRCQFPSRNARRIETLCSPESSRIACRNVCWSIAANLKLPRALRGEVYSSWSWGVLRDIPGFSGSIIEGKNERIRVGTDPSRSTVGHAGFDCSPPLDRIVLRADAEQG